MQWQLQDSRTLGIIVLPRIELTPLSVVQRWFAVTSEPGLRCDISSSQDTAVGTADEFQSRWGDSLGANDLSVVVANASTSRALAVTVQPRQTQPRIEESLHVAAGADGLRLQFEADVDIGATDQFQTSLFVSGEIQVDEVAVNQAGQNLPVRWSRTSKNSVDAFFGVKMTDDYRLVVRGHVRSNPSRTYAVPHIASNLEAAVRRAQFYRDNDTLLEVRGLPLNDESDLTAAETPAWLWEARPVRGFQFASSSLAGASLVVAPNEIRTSGQTLTALERESDAWWTVFSCRLSVEQGELGSLRLIAPATWTGPLELQSNPPATVDIVPHGAEQSAVVVRFTDPVVAGTAINIRLRGRLDMKAASPVVVPEIALETAFVGKHYIQVPSSVDLRPVAWTERGVQPSRLPSGFVTAAASTRTTTRVFEVTERPIHVELQPQATDSSDATVKLADSRVIIGPFGGQLIESQMVVVSQDLMECVLELPPGQRLVRVTSDGIQALTRQLDERHWAVPLGAARLPQLLEVVTLSPAVQPSGDGSNELLRPTLLHKNQPIPVEISLWTLGFAAQHAQQRVAGVAVVPELEQTTLRLDRLVSIVESATASASSGRSPMVAIGIFRGPRRLTALQRHAAAKIGRLADERTALQVKPTPEDDVHDVAARLDAWLYQCSEIWGSLVPWPSVPNSAGVDNTPEWESEWSATADWIYCVAEGNATRVEVQAIYSPATQSQSRLMALLAVVVLAIGAVAIVRWPTGREWITRWPHAVAFTAGLAYWAFLWPSALGLVVALASLWLALRPGWPGRSVPLEGSTILRSGQST